MQEPNADFPRTSDIDVALMKLLARHGGAMRIGPLLREAALPRDALCETINDLAQRRCLRVTWRRTPHATLPPRLRDADRVTLTRFGRSRLPVPWLWHPPRLSRRRRYPKHRPYD
jgi:hypothetical protein